MLKGYSKIDFVNVKYTDVKVKKYGVNIKMQPALGRYLHVA